MKTLKALFAITIFLSAFSVRADEGPKTDEFEVNGMKVILRHSVKGTVSARLFVQGGTANYTKDKEGIENLALNLVMSSGPQNMTKTEFDAAAERVGANLNASSGYDYSNMSLNCVNMYWDESWKLFADAITDPAFRQDDFDILKQRLITGAKQASTNPDTQLDRLSMSNTWGGTDYEKIPAGSPESLESITLDDAKKHFNKVVTRKNTFLVVVGNITKEDLMKKVEASLAKLPEGKAPKKVYAGEKVDEGIFVEDRDIETNYIQGVFSAPEKGTDASVYNSLAMSILGDRFFEELRTKRSLSYAPAAYSTGYMARPQNEIYISTTDPKASLEVMIDEVNKVKTDGFEKKELDGKKQEYLTHYFMGQQTNSSISMSLGITEMNGGWEQMDNFTDRVLGTNIDDINTVMQEYGDKIYWTYLGKESLVQPEYFKQPVKPEKMKK